MLLNPKDIKFTQPTINDTYSNKNLTIYEHLYGLKGPNPIYSVNDFPRIRVTKINGEWCSIDNRRLWVLKQLGKNVEVEEIDHTLEFDCKMSSRTGDGSTVTIIPNPHKHLIYKLLKYSKCPYHGNKMGWKYCYNKHPCGQLHCSKRHPCHNTRVKGSCGCTFQVGTPFSIPDRLRKLKNIHGK